MMRLPTEFQEGRVSAYSFATALNHRSAYNALQSNETHALSTPKRTGRIILLGYNALDAAAIDTWFSTQSPFITQTYHLRRASEAADRATRYFYQVMPRENSEACSAARQAWAEAISVSGIVTILRALKDSEETFLSSVQKAQRFLQQSESIDSAVTQILHAQMNAITLGRTNQMTNGYASRISAMLLQQMLGNES